jgi:hypothetical protein
LIKDEISDLNFTALQVIHNDNINNHALDMLGKIRYLVPSSEKNKQQIKTNMKLLRYTAKIDIMESIEEQTNGPIRYDNKERMIRNDIGNNSWYASLLIIVQN